jgi:hypothetical protein
MRDNPIRAYRCLHCHKKHDMALDIDGQAQPKPGNITICIDCGHVMVFGHDMWPRNPTREEQIEMAGDKRLLAAQRVLGAFKAGKAKA